MAKKSFEDSLLRLKEIVSTLEKGEAGLSDSMKLFSEGTALVSSCNAMLDEARQKVTAVSFSGGEVIETQFSDAN